MYYVTWFDSRGVAHKSCAIPNKSDADAMAASLNRRHNAKAVVHFVWAGDFSYL